MSEVSPVVSNRFVLGGDLNHHGTLFAGRTASWFIETGLMAVCHWVPAEDVVCAHLHGMGFAEPVHLGETVTFTGKAVLAGRTSFVAHIDVKVGERAIMDGFVTYVTTGADGKSRPHGVTLEAVTPEDQVLQERARQVRRAATGK